MLGIVRTAQNLNPFVTFSNVKRLHTVNKFLLKNICVLFEILSPSQYEMLSNFIEFNIPCIIKS